MKSSSPDGSLGVGDAGGAEHPVGAAWPEGPLATTNPF